MKKKLIASGVTALLAAGALSFGVAAPASAHTPAAYASCEAVTVDAVYYDGTKPGSGEPTIEVENPDYVAGTPGSPAVGYPTLTIANPDYVAPKAAVTKTEYLYKQMVTGKEKWLDSLTWNPGLGWFYAGESRTTEVSPAVPEQGTPTIEVANPDYVAEVPATPAVGEPTKWIDNPDYVAPNDAPNSVVVTVDGEVVLDEVFGSSFHDVVPFANKYVGHEWSVTITAWNDPQGYKGWTKTISGTSTPCDVPVVPAAPNANGEAQCGVYSITLYNQQGEYEQALTASFVVYVDGKFDSTYAVEGGEQQTITGAFAEDSGNHQIIVRTGPAQGDEFVFSLDVTSDCIAPQPEADVVTEQTVPVIPCDAEVGDEIDTTTTVTTTPYVLVEGGWVPGEAVITTEDSVYVVTEADVAAAEECPVVTPPTEKPTTTPAPAAKPVAAAGTVDGLAQTGGEVAPFIVGGAFALILAGAAVWLMAATRRQSKADAE